MLLIELNGNEKREMPRAVYHQCVWIIRDYNRLASIGSGLNWEVMYGPGPKFYADENDGLISYGVINEAIHRTKCIEEAFSIIPDELKEGIYRNIVKNERFPDIASDNTWKKWKQRCIYKLAEKLNLY